MDTIIGHLKEITANSKNNENRRNSFDSVRNTQQPTEQKKEIT